MTGNCGERFEPLKVELRRHGDATVVIASGEIDLSSADRLQTLLLDELAGARRVVLDLQRVVFIDASGLHCLLDVHNASRVAGVEFALVPGPPAIQRIFQLTKANELLCFVDHPEAASPRCKRRLTEVGF